MNSKDNMEKQKVKFNGRKIGAIGKTYIIQEIVEIPKGTQLDEKYSRICDCLYDKYECISDLMYIGRGE